MIKYRSPLIDIFKHIFVVFSGLAGARVVNRLIKFVVFAYLARVMGPATYGILAFAFRFMLPFASVADFGLEITAIRLISRYPNAQKYLTIKLLKLRAITGFAAYGIMVFIMMVWPLDLTTKICLLLFGIYLFFGEVTFNWPFFALGDYKEYSISVLISSLVVLAIPLFVKSSQDLYLAIILLGLGNVIGVLYLIYRYLQKYYRRIGAEYFLANQELSNRGIFSSTYKIAIGQIFNRLYLQVVPIIIGFTLSSSHVAIYDVASQIPTFIISMAPMFMNALVLPTASIVYSEMRESSLDKSSAHWKKLENIFKVLWIAVLVFLFVAVLFSISFSGILITFLYGKAFIMAKPIFIILIMQSSIGIICLGYRSLLPAFNREEIYTWFTIIGTIVVAILGYFLLHFFGIVGSGYAYLVSEILLLIISLVYLYRIKLAPVFSYSR